MGLHGPHRLPADSIYRKLPEPPGVVYVSDSLWLDEAEVANIHWLEYLHHIRKDSSRAFYQSQLPDSLCWTRLYRPTSLPIGGLKVYAYSGFEIYPGFRYFPVVGVSYAQAQAFCRWRSAVVNRNLHSAEYLRQYPMLRQYKVCVEYRLPTLAEWETAAAAGTDVQRYPLGKTLSGTVGNRSAFARKAQDSAVAACLQQLPLAQRQSSLAPIPYTVLEQAYVGPDSVLLQCQALRTDLSDGVIRTAYIYANPPNMVGNVAELTATEGVAKGGAFSHSIRDITIGTNFPYDRPQAWLGFRCACTVRVRPQVSTP